MRDDGADRPAEPRLLARVHAVARTRHLRVRTKDVYRSWIVQFVRFHDLKHPAELGADDVRRFLEWLATERALAASTLNQAHAAILFLYRDVLREPDRCPASIPYAKPSQREAVVLSPDEAGRLLAVVPSPRRLVVSLLYGAGLRLTEAVTLRVNERHGVNQRRAARSLARPVAGSGIWVRTMNPRANAWALHRRSARCDFGGVARRLNP